MSFSLFYITTQNNKEAREIAQILVEERIVACANIFDGVQSIYRWNGALCNETEAVLIVKTQKHLGDILITRVKELHSYSCPCIVELPILDGNPDFLKWIREETGTAQ